MVTLHLVSRAINCIPPIYSRRWLEAYAKKKKRNMSKYPIYLSIYK